MGESKSPPAPEALKSGQFDCRLTFPKESHRDLARRFASLMATEIPLIEDGLTAAVLCAEQHPALKKGPDSERKPQIKAKSKGAS